MKSNNLDTLRLILASLVVLEHTNNLFHLAQGDPGRFDFFLLNLSGVAVSAFFVISGMLTYASFERDPDVVRFYLRRFFRVFPAYWTVLALQIVAFTILATALIDWDALPRYVIANVLTANFLQPSFIEGVSAINGSLWTIKIEASYYVILPFLFPLLARKPTLLILSLLSLIWAVALPNETLAKQLPGKLYLFGLGVMLARYASFITPRLSLIALLSLPLGLVALFQLEHILLVGEIAQATVSVAVVVAFMRHWFARETVDISYTLYLVHYPILVALTHFVLPGQSFITVLVTGLVLSLACAVALSYLLERPALAIGRRLVSRHRKATGNTG